MALDPYSKIGWKDNLVDQSTGETIQTGTSLNQTNLNHMDDGIGAVTDAVRQIITGRTWGDLKGG